MIVNVNMSREVFEYYKGHNLSRIVDMLLEMYDFTNLPPTSGQRDVERKVNVSNEMYISIYNTLGPRSKKCSLGRLLEYGYTMDVLALSRFEQMRVDVNDDPTYSLLEKAYKALLTAQKYCKDSTLREITKLVYNYMGDKA